MAGGGAEMLGKGRNMVAEHIGPTAEFDHLIGVIKEQRGKECKGDKEVTAMI